MRRRRKRGAVEDAWFERSGRHRCRNNRISYGVTEGLTTTQNTSMVRTPPSTYPAGTILVQNASGAQQTTAAAYVLISHGADIQFAYTESTGAYRGNSQWGQTSGGQFQNADAQHALGPRPQTLSCKTTTWAPTRQRISTTWCAGGRRPWCGVAALTRAETLPKGGARKRGFWGQCG